MTLHPSEYDPYYKNYIEKAAGVSILEGLKMNLSGLTAFYSSIPDKKLEYRYAPEKWTIKDILLHVTDAERVFAYRALRIGRSDTIPLSGFDQNTFVMYANANDRSIESLLEEYRSVRLSTISLFESFSEDDMMLIGVASNADVSVRALGYIIIGHENHHSHIIKERYLDK
ncbi:MAG: DinB family protein [Bacteroidota bacterium]